MVPGFALEICYGSSNRRRNRRNDSVVLVTFAMVYGVFENKKILMRIFFVDAHDSNKFLRVLINIGNLLLFCKNGTL